MKKLSLAVLSLMMRSAVPEVLGQPNDLDGWCRTPTFYTHFCLAKTTPSSFTTHTSGLCQGSRLKFLSTLVESSLVIGGSEKMLRIITRLDTLAANNHNTLDEQGAPELWKNEVDKRKIHSAPRQDRKRAHTLGFGCIYVSHASTGYEPKARINGSSTGYEPKMLSKTMCSKLDMMSAKNCRVQLAGRYSKQAPIRSSPRDSAVINVSEKDTMSIQTGDSSILGKWKTLAQTQCDNIDIQTRSQGILSVRYRGQRVKSRDPRNLRIGPHLKANGQRRGNTESTKQEAPSQSRRSTHKFARQGYRQVPLELVNEHDLSNCWQGCR